MVKNGVIEGENLFEGSQNSIVMTTKLKEKEISQSMLAIKFVIALVCTCFMLVVMTISYQ